MQILHIPCLEDNYSYMIIDDATKEAAVVDPVEPHKILRVAQENGVDLKLVLTTHHHWDHAGGNDKLKQLMPEIKIYGGSVDNVQGCTNKVENGDKLSLGADISILALHTPCHTKGHISYYVTGKEGEDPAVFTGDTLVSSDYFHSRHLAFGNPKRQMPMNIFMAFGVWDLQMPNAMKMFMSFGVWGSQMPNAMKMFMAFGIWKPQMPNANSLILTFGI
ncbi:hypothetical protein RD792_005155 [Penstemon davidsonii]|uniref:hydroxyacylglutathione hydrolase n=1 Tax=Penstemon davidsonii TaxID=160366 RepID=A0ABR0DJD4_9LAMI|nr:hypothetical protein RD792_005155 [Penstemon davidsonii]